MAFKPGNPGRPKGSKNKKKVLRVEDVLVAKEKNPVEEIIAMMPQLKPIEQVETWMKLIPYYQAVVKADDGFFDDDDHDEDDTPVADLISLARG